jgi:hypothetical protein
MTNSDRSNSNAQTSLIAKSNAGNGNDVILYADPATHSLLVTASVAISGGSKTNNAAAPTSDNLGALVAVASASAQSWTEGNQVLLSTDLTGALRVTGSLSVGGTTDNTAYTAGTSTGTPAMGFYHSVVDSVTDGRAATVAITVKRAQHVALFDAAGNALLGQKAMAASIPVTIASDQASIPVAATLAAETTKVIGTVNIAAAQTIAVTNTGTFAVQATPVTQADTFMLGGVNIKEINAVTPLMGNGITGTGSLRVTIASDNTAFSVNATLAAETTKVIGTTRTLGNAGAVLDGVNTAATAPANGVLGLGIYNSTEPSPTTGQSVGIQLDSKGRQRTVVMDAAGNTRGQNVNANSAAMVAIDQTTLGTTNGVSVAAVNAAAALAGNGVTGTGSLRVTLASDNSAIALWGHGATAASVPANAVLRGGRAATANPTAVTDGQMVGAMADKLGRTVVVLGNVRDLKGNQFTTITSSTTETTVVTAVAATFLDVYGCIVENTSATACKVTFKDSTAGTTQFEIYVPAGDTRGFMLPSSDGFKQTTVNTAWTATCGTSVASIVISMLYVKNI